MTVPSPLPAWFLPLMRYAHGLQHRPAAAPRPAPHWFLGLRDEFNEWNGWLTAGRPKPRPATFWKEPPQWAWLLRKELARARPAVSAAPVAKAPPPSWTDGRPVVFTAWEAGLARTGGWTVARIVVPGVAPVWQVDGVGYIAQSEDPTQAPGALKYLKGVQGQKAVVATQAGWENPQPFLDAGINVCFVEAYGPEGWPYSDTERMLWQAQHDGWPYVIPCVGCYHGYPLSSYNLEPYAHRFSVWLAEEMQDADWQRLSTLL